MRKILPAVVIGLGGKVVKTITFLKKNLLEQAPDVAEFVRFLAIDIDELRGEAPPASLFGDPIRLDPEKNEFYRIVDQTRDHEARHIPEISSWFPEEGYKYLPLTEGARQAKPVGRLGFFLSHADLARRIHSLTDKVVTPEIRSRFPGLKAGELNIYLVASICGGTGAGLFADIAYELRYMQGQAGLPDKTRIKGLFALGDVYAPISNRVLANTYASLRELNWVQREGADFHPVYPRVSRDVIHAKAFDAIYLFGSSNNSSIEFGSADDFAQLCAEFIFLDSGADAQEGGDPLSAMIQSVRNNAEVYTMNYDADGTPRCFSSLGLCKIRFPAERVAELCAVRMAHSIIEHHIAGHLSEADGLDARRQAQEFLITEGFACDADHGDFPNRLIEKQLERGERTPLDSWVTQNLVRAQNSFLENLKDLEIGRINHIVNTIASELSKFQEELPIRVIEELSTFNGIVEQTVRKMFQENRGVSFVERLLKEVYERVVAARDFAQQEIITLVGREKRLADQMNHHIREMASLLGRGLLSFLRNEAKRAQLRETSRAIRQYFLDRINVMKLRAVVDFCDGVYDDPQRLLAGGEGAIARLSKKIADISLIQAFVAKQARSFQEAYEQNKRIKGSPFEILIYDQTYFSELHEIFDAVYSDALRASLFAEILRKIGGSIWHIQDYIADETAAKALREHFIAVCRQAFQPEIDRKTVAQRIVAAKQRATHPIDYGPNLQSAYEVADYFCRLNDGAAGFADLRDSEQSVTCVVAYLDPQDTGWESVQSMLRESMARSGRQLPFSHTSDRHNILIYREFAGFPAYTLSRIRAYYNNYLLTLRDWNEKSVESPV